MHHFTIEAVTRRDQPVTLQFYGRDRDDVIAFTKRAYRKTIKAVPRAHRTKVTQESNDAAV